VWTRISAWMCASHGGCAIRYAKLCRSINWLASEDDDDEDGDDDGIDGRLAIVGFGAGVAALSRLTRLGL